MNDFTEWMQNQFRASAQRCVIGLMYCDRAITREQLEVLIAHLKQIRNVLPREPERWVEHAVAQLNREG